MNFEEFRAVSNRQKSSKLVENNNLVNQQSNSLKTKEKKESNKTDTKEKEEDDDDLLMKLKNDEATSTSKTNSIKKTSYSNSKKELNTGNAIMSSINYIINYITNIVEQNEIQALYVGILLIDTFCAFTLLLLSYGINYNADMDHNSANTNTNLNVNANPTSMNFEENELTRDVNMLTSQLSGVLTTIYSFFILETGYHHPLIVYVCIPTLQSICLLSLLFFCLEIMLVIIAFQTRVFSHVGYMFDMVIICIQFYETMGFLPSMIQSHSHPAMVTYRIFNIVRCWRFFRLYTIYINLEVNKHMRTKKILEDKVKDNKVLEIDRFRLENDLRKEKESLNAVETMLQNYKEEVFTLNEALKIAALDIAEIAQTDENEVELSDLSALEGVDDETLAQMSEDDLMKLMENVVKNSATDKTSINNTLNQLQSTLQSHDAASGKGSNIEQVYRHVKSDVQSKDKEASSKGSTFIVSEDGSFNQN